MGDEGAQAEDFFPRGQRWRRGWQPSPKRSVLEVSAASAVLQTSHHPSTHPFFYAGTKGGDEADAVIGRR
jgi:hypothetical protein